MSLIFLISCLVFVSPTIQDQSKSYFSNFGLEFLAIDNSSSLISILTTKSRLFCSAECNKLIDCRTFDYDDDSKQCRIWNADLTTGSIVPSPSKPRSSVGTIQLSTKNYINSHNQSCDKCQYSRYEICDTITNTCQCPSKTYWNGSMCLTQLFQNQICTSAEACRSDLNLTCRPSCDMTYRCQLGKFNLQNLYWFVNKFSYLIEIPIGTGETVAGFCNDTTGNGASGIKGPWGIYVSQIDGTVYFTDYDFKNVQAISPYNRTSRILFSGGLVEVEGIFVDKSNTIYMADRTKYNGTVYIQKDGVIIRSFPTPGLSTSGCLLSGLYSAYGVAADQFGNIYVSVSSCYAVVKWEANATSGVVVAGQIGDEGSTSDKLSYLRFIYLDENHNTIYVCDEKNNRVQKFIIGGNGTAVTAAGNGTAGTGLNQLNSPSGVWVTRDAQTLYVADYGNNRIMKWTIGDTEGTVFVGNMIQLLNGPGGIALDSTETYLYVADYGNHRIQRFRLR